MAVHAHLVFQLRLIVEIPRRPQKRLQVLLGNAHRSFLAAYQAFDSLSAGCGNLAFQAAHTRLCGVMADDREQRIVGKLDLFRCDAIFLRLLWHEITLCNLQLFLLQVGRNLDDLHAIQQRARNGIGAVGRCDKQHMR